MKLKSAKSISDNLQTYVQVFDGLFVITLVDKIHYNGRSCQEKEDDKTKEVYADCLHPPNCR